MQLLDDFKSLSLENFWLKYLTIYQNVSRLALLVIVRFSASHEAGFSTLDFIKINYLNRMGVVNNVRCALSLRHPQGLKLVENKQLHP